MEPLKIQDVVKYIGHTKACDGELCGDSFEDLIGKVGIVVNESPDGFSYEVPISGESWWLMRSHLELVKTGYDPYQLGFDAGVKEGLRRAALIAAHQADEKVYPCGEWASCANVIKGAIESDVICPEYCTCRRLPKS